nr:MAG TPA: hypothetical protein [Caudoviricetes sp.]
MTASRGPVATFSWVRSRPHASRMVRASLITPAGVMSVHLQPLPEAPNGEGGSEGDEAGGESGDGVGDAGEDELAGPVEFAVDAGVGAAGGCVTHQRGSFRSVVSSCSGPRVSVRAAWRAATALPASWICAVRESVSARGEARRPFGGGCRGAQCLLSFQVVRTMTMEPAGAVA